MFYFVGFAPAPSALRAHGRDSAQARMEVWFGARDLVDHLGLSESVFCWVAGNSTLQLRLLISGFLDGGDLACLDGNYWGFAGRFPWRHQRQVGGKPRGPSLIPGQGGPRAHPLSPTVPLSVGSSCSRGFTMHPPSQNLQQGGQGLAARWMSLSLEISSSWRTQHGLLLVPFNPGVG